jgi:hypothetical protein
VTLYDTHARLQWQLRDRLPMWVVYDHPRDYPYHYVARMHLTLPGPKPTDHIILAKDLDALRDDLPPGLTRLARQPDDDPKIIEVWL